MYLNLRNHLTTLFIGLFLSTQAQQVVPFDAANWIFEGDLHQVSIYQGKEALTLEGAVARLKDVALQDGIIEWDMAFTPKRGFSGLRFRMIDDANSEEFYLRPHQSGNPDANQYCPVDNTLASWQLYHGPAYSAAIDYPFHEWFHVKMVISGSRAEVYIKDMDKPLLYIPVLKHTPTKGGLMLYAANTPVYFANFSYQAMDGNPPNLVNPVGAAPLPDPTTIKQWEVSQAFAEAELEGITELSNWKMDMEWQVLPAENSGLANIATRVPFQRQTANTVFVRYTIEATHKHLKPLQFGFSDRARVFVNGQLMFAGNDGFRTRDYRYLGTIGYHDTVYLPLKKGQNEVWIAVSENFGGWAVQGRWIDLDGITK